MLVEELAENKTILVQGREWYKGRMCSKQLPTMKIMGRRIPERVSFELDNLESARFQVAVSINHPKEVNQTSPTEGSAC